MNQEKRNEIMEILSKYYPDPKSALEYSNPFELLVSVVLAAQATDASVNIATRELYKVAPTPKAICELGEEKLKEYIRHIGLYNTKAKHVIELCRNLCDHHNSQVPEDFDTLVKMPGVGRKTASVVMNVAFRHPYIAVDTHVFRVSNRTGYARGKTPDEVQKKLEKYTAPKYRLEAHHYFIYLGREICKARKPECWRCPIEKLCEYKDKTPAPEPKPVKKKRVLPIVDATEVLEKPADFKKSDPSKAVHQNETVKTAKAKSPAAAKKSPKTAKAPVK